MSMTDFVTRAPWRRMRRGWPVLLLLALLAGGWTGWAGSRAAAQTAGTVLGASGLRGISFVPIPTAPFGSPQAADSLRRLAATGANWVAIVAPFREASSSAHDFYRGGEDPSLDAVGQEIDLAHSLNLKVMLQPIVLSNDGVWNGWFQPDDIHSWFLNYQAMILDYARTANDHHADLLCVGTEFFTLTTPVFSPSWRDLVAAVRGVYSGQLTYSANWGDKHNPEFVTIDWWDTLDYIGISAYFPLSWNNFLTDPLAAGWRNYQDPFGANAQGTTFHWFDAIAAVHQRWNKPILFTKIGFASYANSPGRWDVPPDPYLELSVQANAYDATMRVWGQVDWMQGIFWSPWYSAPTAGGPRDNGESPQNKPAENVLGRWYGGHP